jgi:hypothetical protein
MSLSVAQLIREAVLLRDEATFVDAYLVRTTFIQGATGALLILHTDADTKFGLKTEPSDSIKCFSVGFEMTSFATKITSWSEFLESRLKYGFEEDLDYFESTCIDSTSKERIFYFGHALRDGTGQSRGCVIYSANAASSHELMQSQIGEFGPLCFVRVMGLSQAIWISEFEKRFSVSHISHSVFPVLADSMRKLGHGINNHLATLSLQLQSLSSNSTSSSVVKTGVSRSLLAIKRIDDSIQVLEAFSSIILNESSTSFLENYIIATFEILRKDFNSVFLSVLIDQNFDLDKTIIVDGPSLLFLIHNFLRFALVVVPVMSDSAPVMLVCHARGCSQHSDCGVISSSYKLGNTFEPVFAFLDTYKESKIGGPLSPPVIIVMNAAKKLGAEFKIFRDKEESIIELHLPLTPQ